MEQNQFAVNGNLLKRSGAAILDFIVFTLVSLFLISSAIGPFYDSQYDTSSLSEQFTTYQLQAICMPKMNPQAKFFL